MNHPSDIIPISSAGTSIQTSNSPASFHYQRSGSDILSIVTTRMMTLGIQQIHRASSSLTRYLGGIFPIEPLLSILETLVKVSFRLGSKALFTMLPSIVTLYRTVYSRIMSLLPVSLRHQLRIPRAITPLSVYSILPVSAKFGTITSILGLLYYFTNWLFKTNNFFGPPILSFSAQIVGIRALSKVLSQLQSELGVKTTVSPSFLFLSTIGSFVYTLSQFSLLQKARNRISDRPASSSSRSHKNLTIFPFTIHSLGFLEKLLGNTRLFKLTNSPVLASVFFSFNMMYSFLYAYGFYLSSNYNRGLGPVTVSSSMVTGPHIPSLIAWTLSSLITTHRWLLESSRTLRKGNWSTIFSYLGFVLSASGYNVSGLISALTSVPQITPFSGTITFATATILACLSLLPYYETSGTARVYGAGYLTMCTSMLIQSYHAFLEEQRAVIAKSSPIQHKWPFQHY